MRQDRGRKPCQSKPILGTSDNHGRPSLKTCINFNSTFQKLPGKRNMATGTPFTERWESSVLQRDRPAEATLPGERRKEHQAHGTVLGSISEQPKLAACHPEGSGKAQLERSHQPSWVSGLRLAQAEGAQAWDGIGWADSKVLLFSPPQLPQVRGKMFLQNGAGGECRGQAMLGKVRSGH